MATTQGTQQCNTSQKMSQKIPAPRPHGMIRLRPFSVVFMSYIPAMTLKEAWPKLSHEQKVSVQQQLDGVFRELRTLRKPDGQSLGGVGGEGINDQPQKYVNTAADFDSIKYSVPHHGSTSYTSFLLSFLTRPVGDLVFMHGDVRQDNITVTLNQDNTCTVTGIIDWEDAGFYPEYHGCTQLTRTLSITQEDDWYLYLPNSIAPSQFPVRWLVNRLWGTHLKGI